MEPLISVIVPVYNVEPYLRKCVDSILNQTYHNLEVILVDDGSPDRCPEICDVYAGKDQRVRVLHKKNGGQAIARNIGMQYASGDYITFVDSDDWVEAELYNTVMKQAPFRVAIFGVTLDVSNTGKKTVVNACEAPRVLRLDKDGEDLCRLAEMSLLGYACNKVYSKDLLENKMFPDAKLREDLVFNLNAISDISEIQLINTEGYHYVQHCDSTLHASYLGIVPDIRTVGEQMVSIHPMLSDQLNRKTASHMIKTYLCDAFSKYIFKNEALSEFEAVDEIRKVFSSRVIRDALILSAEEGKLFVLLTVCAKIKAARIFYQIVKRLWHE